MGSFTATPIVMSVRGEKSFGSVCVMWSCNTATKWPHRSELFLGAWLIMTMLTCWSLARMFTMFSTLVLCVNMLILGFGNLVINQSSGQTDILNGKLAAFMERFYSNHNFTSHSNTHSHWWLMTHSHSCVTAPSQSLDLMVMLDEKLGDQQSNPLTVVEIYYVSLDERMDRLTDWHCHS